MIKVWLPAAANLISSNFFFRYAQSLHYIDSNRIAVTGVSYGAYLATLMLADTGDREHPNMLACGVAVSPVVDWRFYGNIQIYYIIYYHILNYKCYIIINLCISYYTFSESAYTERYMGLPLPSENFRGYQKTSLIEQCQNIKGKDYFLAHGMADRNVHFQNSMIIAKLLVNHNIPFDQHVS